MPETVSYAGYVKRPSPIDWGAVAGGIVTKMEDVEKEHAAFREKHDKMAFDVNKQLSEYESTKAPALDQVMFQLINDGKNVASQTHNRLKHKDIDPSFMGMTHQSMTDSLTELYGITSNIGTALTEAQDQVDEGDANTVMQQWAIDQYKENTNFKGSKPIWSQNQDNGYTNILLQKIDPQTGDPITGPGTTTSIKTLNNMNNLRFAPIDLDADLKDFKNSFEVVRDEEGVTYRPITPEATDSFINGYISDPRRALALLTQVGDEKGTYSPYAEGETPTDKERSILMKVNDDYEYVPDFTKDQLIAAKNILIERISRLGGTKQPIPKKGGGSGSGGGQTVSEEKAENQYLKAQGIVSGDETIIKEYENQTGRRIEHSKDKGGITIFDDKGVKVAFAKFEYTDASKSKIKNKETIDRLMKHLYDEKDKPTSTTIATGRSEAKKHGKVVDESGAITRKEYIPSSSADIIFKHPNTKKDISGVKAIADYPDKFTKEYFDKLGIKGVKISGTVSNSSDTFSVKVKIGGSYKTFKIHKSTRDSSGYKNVQAKENKTKADVQKIIDEYYKELSQDETKQDNVLDMQIGSKYNVA